MQDSYNTYSETPPLRLRWKLWSKNFEQVQLPERQSSDQPQGCWEFHSRRRLRLPLSLPTGGRHCLENPVNRWTSRGNQGEAQPWRTPRRRERTFLWRRVLLACEHNDSVNKCKTPQPCLNAVLIKIFLWPTNKFPFLRDLALTFCHFCCQSAFNYVAAIVGKS